MTARDRLEQAAIMMGSAMASSAARDELLLYADEELRAAALAFYRSLSPRKLARIRRRPL